MHKWLLTGGRLHSNLESFHWPCPSRGNRLHLRIPLAITRDPPSHEARDLRFTSLHYISPLFRRSLYHPANARWKSRFVGTISDR